eukprot:TRINITY_DN13710_c0_g1_i1.p1 TRINITY_DN13710_c0_g1~~TRINITY_DN13710_c0_g1_i1.p1  ORF type:complete len:415 (-),score=124.78 TRINITY_DN13710_c0_g1_i1:21-1211(-)
MQDGEEKIVKSVIHLQPELLTEVEINNWNPIPKLKMEDIDNTKEFIMGNYNSCLTLNQFESQVAGHDMLLTSKDNKLIFKPAIPRELWYYTVLDNHYPEYTKFTAKYLGMLNINNLSEKEKLLTPKEDNKTNSQSNRDSGLWAREILRRKEEETITNHNHTHFIVLEDLTQDFSKPCIMDIKIGTRAHGDDSTVKKVRSQTLKCNTTTSKDLGLRICGYQVYECNNDEYRYFHKYQGRELTKMNFHEEMGRFFNNGNGINVNAITKIIPYLTSIKNLINEKPTFKFYSSSLLIIYEGDDGLSDQISTPILKMIDFAHTHQLTDDFVNDDGYLIGIDNLIHVCNRLVDQEKTNNNNNNLVENNNNHLLENNELPNDHDNNNNNNNNLVKNENNDDSN